MIKRPLVGAYARFLQGFLGEDDLPLNPSLVFEDFTAGDLRDFEDSLVSLWAMTTENIRQISRDYLAPVGDTNPGYYLQTHWFNQLVEAWPTLQLDPPEGCVTEVVNYLKDPWEELVGAWWNFTSFAPISYVWTRGVNRLDLTVHTVGLDLWTSYPTTVLTGATILLEVAHSLNLEPGTLKIYPSSAWKPQNLTSRDLLEGYVKEYVL